MQLNTVICVPSNPENECFASCCLWFTFDIYELLLGQRLSIHWVRPILSDVLLDQPALKHLVGHRRDARVLWDLVGDCKKRNHNLHINKKQQPQKGLVSLQVQVHGGTAWPLTLAKLASSISAVLVLSMN